MYPDAEVLWVVLSAEGDRAEEARRSAASSPRASPLPVCFLGEFRDGFLPYAGGEVKEFFEGLKDEIAPDVIFTHHRSDLHQDHRFACELAWNTFRNHLVLEYEIPKFDGDMGAPNVFVHLDDQT